METTAPAVKVGTACLRGAFGDIRDLIMPAQRALAGVTFATMAGTGMSGALVVPILARAMGKNFVILRKPGDRHHHGDEIAEGTIGGPWLFVDDGIATGSTYARTRHAMADLYAQHGLTEKFAGAYLYGHAVSWDTPMYLTPAELAAMAVQ